MQKCYSLSVYFVYETKLVKVIDSSNCEYFVTMCRHPQKIKFSEK